MCSLLLTQLSDVKQDEISSLLLTALSDIKQDETFLASDLAVKCKAR
jgi:hypothetical protein